MVEDYQENYNTGWIKLHRSIINHWIFKDEVKFKAWITILCEVNHKPKKLNIGNLLLDCERGESLNSLDTWAKIFGGKWNKSKVRRFFELLEYDNMILTKSEQKTTRLIVRNYSVYQDLRNADETQVKRKLNASETQTTPNKNDNNAKNEKNENKHTATPFSFFNSLVSLGVKKELANDWIKVRKTKKLTNTETAFNNLKKEFDKSNIPINDIIEKCIIESWGGFKNSWLNKSEPQKINGKEFSANFEHPNKRPTL